MKSFDSLSSIPHFAETKKLYNAFTECQYDNCKQKIYGSFLKQFDLFLSENEKSEAIGDFVGHVTNEILGYLPFVQQSNELLISTLLVLTRCCNYIQISYDPQGLVILLINSFICIQNDISLLQKCKTLFVHLLTNKINFTDFVNSGGLVMIFNCVFTELNSEDLAVFIVNLFFNYIPEENYEFVSFDQVLLTFLSVFKKGNIYSDVIFEATIFVTNFYKVVSNYNSQLTEHFLQEIFEIIQTNHNNFTTQQLYKVYEPLLNSYNDNFLSPPNLACYLYLGENYLKQEGDNQYIIQLIIDVLEKYTKDFVLQALNNTFQLKNFFHKSDMEYTRLFKLINILDKEQEVLLSCIIPFLKHTNKITVKIIDIIYENVESHNINKKVIYDTGFLNKFYIELSPQKMIHFFLKTNKYLKLVSGLINYTDKESQLFEVLVSSIDYFPNMQSFIHVCSEFLNYSLLPENFIVLMQTFDKYQNSEFLRIFQLLFLSNPESAKMFVNIGGVNWIFQCTYVNDEIFVDVLSSLVINQRFDEIETVILSLPKDHRIFHLSQDKLNKIAYGLNTSVYRPIRVYSLSHLITLPEKLDPYNSWILGYCYIDNNLAKYSNFEDIPHLYEIVNRFTLARHIPLYLSHPFNLHKYCDFKYDHFPLFQIFPGPHTFKITLNYSCVSFWFKFEIPMIKQTQFCHNDFITISNINNKLIISNEKENKTIEINPLEWNYVNIRLENKIISNLINVQINQDELSFSIKKQNKFSFLSFSSISNTLLYLGPAIRFFPTYVKTDAILNKGPGYFRQLKLYPDSITVTPYLINTPNKEFKCECPSTCVYVSYFGFPLHFTSLRMLNKLVSVINTATNIEEFNSIFRSLININNITKYNSIRFWPKLLNSLKTCRPFLSKELFLYSLKSISLQQDYEKILSSILFDSEIWEYINNEILIESLFVHFQTVEWENIENFELFLSSIFINHSPKNDYKAIIKILFEYHEKIPKLFKYLKELLKVSPILKIYQKQNNLTKSYSHTILQNELLESLIEYTSGETISTVCNIIKFDDLKGLLMIQNNVNLCKLIFKLLAKIAVHKPNYIVVDKLFLLIVSKLCHDKEIYNDILTIISTSNQEFFGILLILIWNYSLFNIHQYVFSNQNDFKEQLQELLELGLSIIDKCDLNNIFNSINLSIIFGWYPLIFNYYLLFRKRDTQSHTETDNINIHQFPEANDSIWVGSEYVFKNLEFSKSYQVLNPKEFIVQHIAQIFSDANISFKNISIFNIQKFKQFLESSKLLEFITNLTIKAPQQYFGNLMHGFFLSFYFDEKYLSDKDGEGKSNNNFIFYAPLLIHSIYQSCIQNKNNVQISQLLAYTQLFTDLHFLRNYTLIIINDLFDLVENMNKEMIYKYHSNIHSILLSLYQETSVLQYKDLFELLSKRINTLKDIIELEKSTYCWLHLFLIPSINAKQYFDPFFQQFIKVSQNHSKEAEQRYQIIYQELIDQKISQNTKTFSLLENSYKIKIQEVKQNFEILHHYAEITPIRYPVEIGLISKEFSKTLNYIYNQYYLISCLYLHSLKYLNSTFRILEEKTQWAHTINYYRDLFSEPNKFNPINYQLSTQSFPFSIPPLFSPNIFKLEEFSAIHIYHDTIKNYNNNHSNESIQLDKLQLFIKTHQLEYGTPKSIYSIQLIRYSQRIPSILFVYSNSYLILTYSQLNEQRNNLYFIENYKEDDINSKELFEIFLENVFNSQWGQTSIFCSKIIIRIPMESLIHIQQLRENNVNVWSFTNGSFIIEDSKRNIKNILNDLKCFQLPPIPYLFQIQSIQETIHKYSTGQISIFQTICLFNYLSGRSYVDFNNYPVFPSAIEDDGISSDYENDHKKENIFTMRRTPSFIQSKDLPSAVETLSQLSKCSPFDYYFKKYNKEEEDIEFNYEVIPGPILIHHDFYPSQIGQKRAIELIFQNRHLVESPKVLKWIQKYFLSCSIPVRSIKPKEYINNFEREQYSQKLNIFVSNNQNIFYQQNNKLLISSQYSCQIHHLNYFLIILEREKMLIKIVDTRTQEVLLYKYSHLFYSSTNISVSTNGLFILVDYKFGMSRVYRIFYKDEKPYQIHTASIFSFTNKPKSCISGTDWVVCSSVSQKLIIWNIFTSTIHRIINFSTNINYIVLDEHISSLWVFTEIKIYFYTINGTKICSKKFKEKITCAATLNLPKAEKERTTIVGTSTGEIYLIQPNLSEKSFFIKKLPSQHKTSISKISVYECTFITISKDGEVYSWNQYLLPTIHLPCKYFSHCANCDKEPTIYCTSCNRCICSSCCNGVITAALCKDCYKEYLSRKKLEVINKNH